MKVLITGNRGYIGTVMTPMVVNAGHEVIGLDVNLYERCTYDGQIKSIPQINKDIRDVDESDFCGVDAVIHLAALSNDPLGNLNPELTYDINLQGTIHLAKMAKGAGVKRFLFSSSCSNYGAGGDDFLNEESVLNPLTPYGISKVKSEQDLAFLADDNFSPTFMRSSTAYGVSPRLRFDVVLNNLTAWAFTTGRVFLKSDGTPWRPIVHIEDISRAFLAVLNAPRDIIHNQAFNVGQSSENYRISEIAEIVKQTMPNCELEYSKDAAPDKRCYRVDASKIKNLLPEFAPQWTAALGAQQLYESYKENGITLEEFEGPRYKRIDHIKMLLSDGLLDDSLRWCNR